MKPVTFLPQSPNTFLLMAENNRAMSMLPFPRLVAAHLRCETA